MYNIYLSRKIKSSILKIGKWRFGDFVKRGSILAIIFNIKITKTKANFW